MATIRSTFGIFSGATSGGSGVTSVTAGTGLTGGTITTSGTISKNAVSEFDGGSTTLLPVGGAGTRGGFFYNPLVTSQYDITNNNRVSIGVKTVSGVQTRIGIDGLATGDVISMSGRFTTTCSSGTLTLAATFGGVFTSVTPTFVGNGVTCDGTSQNIDFSIADVTIGLTNTTQPANANTEYFGFEYTYTGSGGSYNMSFMDISVTQHITK